MSGILYGVGVGPGEPELITLKALRCIQESDVIILPSAPKEDCHAYRIVKEVYPEVEQKRTLCLPFPMTKDRETLERAHNEIFGQIEKLVEEGLKVAFLTIGDPGVYSTYHYIHRRMEAAGKEVQMVSGVPSFCAAAAALGISLGDMREEIHVIPASYDIEATMELTGTRIYMKSGKKLARLKELLQKQAESRKLEVYAVENCGMAEEKRTWGLEQLDTEAGYLTLVIVKDGGDC